MTLSKDDEVWIKQGQKLAHDISDMMLGYHPPSVIVALTQIYIWMMRHYQPEQDADTTAKILHMAVEDALGVVKKPQKQ